jgi:hypothetical protein
MASTRAHDTEVRSNYEAFRAALPGLLSTNAGEFAVLRHCEVVEFFATTTAAREFAEQEYSDGLYSIQEVTDRKVFISPRTHAVSSGRS